MDEPNLSVPLDPDRFLAAQAPVLDAVRVELARGRKRTHWMWFVFPQAAGLGVSAMSARFAIAGLPQAAAYLDHPVLGPRLLECTALTLAHSGRSAAAIFGAPDDLKFRSSMTLFAAASRRSEFRRALDLFFNGRADPRTLALLGRADGPD